MTLIHVRGRRKARNQSHQSSSNRATTPFTSDKAPFPPSSSSFSSNPRKKLKTSVNEDRTLKKQKRDQVEVLLEEEKTKMMPTTTTGRINTPSQVRQLSILETLPSEILHDILGYCLNLNLPRASPTLGKRFGQRVAENLTIQAFSKPGFHSELGKYRATSCHLSDLEWALCRDQIVCCRWFSRDFLARCAVLYVKHMTPYMMRHSEFIKIYKDGSDVMENQGEVVMSHLNDRLGDGDGDGDGDMDGVGIIQKLSEGNSPLILRGNLCGTNGVFRWVCRNERVYHEFTEDPQYKFSLPSTSVIWLFPFYSAVHDQYPVPDPLCRAPFTPAKLDKLKALRYLCKEMYVPRGYVNYKEPFSQAVRAAISARSPQALSLFLQMGADLEESYCRLYGTTKMHGEFEFLDSDHYVAATYDGRDDMLAMLFQHDHSSLPRDDVRLTEWALEALDRGGDVAKLATEILKVMTFQRPKIG